MKTESTQNNFDSFSMIPHSHVKLFILTQSLDKTLLVRWETTTNEPTQRTKFWLTSAHSSPEDGFATDDPVELCISRFGNCGSLYPPVEEPWKTNFWTFTAGSTSGASVRKLAADGHESSLQILRWGWSEALSLHIFNNFALTWPT